MAVYPHEKGITYDKRSQAPISINDIVRNGKIYAGVSAPTVMVESESDLANLPTYPAGTMAYTAGFKALWQLDASGNWVSMI